MNESSTRRMKLFKKTRGDMMGGKKMIIWAPECSMDVMVCLGGRSGDDHQEDL